MDRNTHAQADGERRTDGPGQEEMDRQRCWQREETEKWKSLEKEKQRDRDLETVQSRTGNQVTEKGEKERLGVGGVRDRKR